MNYKNPDGSLFYSDEARMMAFNDANSEFCRLIIATHVEEEVDLGGLSSFQAEGKFKNKDTCGIYIRADRGKEITCWNSLAIGGSRKAYKGSSCVCFWCRSDEIEELKSWGWGGGG